MAATTINGLQITGEWLGTRLVATSNDLESFFKFGEPKSTLSRGTKIFHITFNGQELADHFLYFHSATNTSVYHVAGRNLTRSMIYANPTGSDETRAGRANFDAAHYLRCMCVNAGALAIHESGRGKCADLKIERCTARQPDTYGLILRNPVRHSIQRFYAGWGQGQAKGAVLIENTPQERASGPVGARQNRLTEVAHENLARNPEDSVTIHIKSLPGADGENYSHEINYPRAHQPQEQQILRVEGTAENVVTDVNLNGLQYTPTHDSAIQLRYAEDCSINFNQRGQRGVDRAKSPPEGVTTENCQRIQYNGVAYNDGDPRSTGEWHENGSEGVTIVDTANDALYRYLNQRWWHIPAQTE
jgi:hypothetical protein